jgi:hypothetical protein
MSNREQMQYWANQFRVVNKSLKRMADENQRRKLNYTLDKIESRIIENYILK